MLQAGCVLSLDLLVVVGCFLRLSYADCPRRCGERRRSECEHNTEFDCARKRSERRFPSNLFGSAASNWYCLRLEFE